MVASHLLPLQNGIQALVAWHNVVGPSGVVNAATETIVRLVGEHYAARAIDHLPFRPEFQHYVLTTNPVDTRPQIDYRGQISDMDFTLISDIDDLDVKEALFLPYIRLRDPNFPPGTKWHFYGLPPAITAFLKNKADIHEWLIENGFAAPTPNHVTCRIDEIPERGRQMLTQIEALYQAAGLSSVYPMGLMIRGALCDGNYGAANIKMALKDKIVDGQLVYKGQIMLKKNGTVDPVTCYENWENALYATFEHIQDTTNPAVDDRVVMTRFLDIDVSPGLSAAVTQGQVHCYGFNGQYTDPGDSACSGTWTFRQAVGETRAMQVTEHYLEQTQQLLLKTINPLLAKVPDRAEVFAMLNIDVMLIGSLEIELWRRAQDNPQLRPWLDAVGRYNENYTPRIYDPSIALFAEINPRDTNWTLAMKAVLQATKRPFTIESLEELANGDGLRVLARDRWPLPSNINFDAAREELLSYHQKLLANDEGFILRMADDPAGVILFSPDPARLDKIAQQAYQMLDQVSANERF